MNSVVQTITCLSKKNIPNDIIVIIMDMINPLHLIYSIYEQGMTLYCDCCGEIMCLDHYCFDGVSHRCNKCVQQYEHDNIYNAQLS